MGTSGEMVQAHAPCKCGYGDLVVGDFFDHDGRKLRIKCLACGQEVEGGDKLELMQEWQKANPRDVETATDIEYAQRIAQPTAGTTVRSDLARAAVLLRELADICERASAMRP